MSDFLRIRVEDSSDAWDMIEWLETEEGYEFKSEEIGNRTRFVIVADTREIMFDGDLDVPVDYKWKRDKEEIVYWVENGCRMKSEEFEVEDDEMEVFDVNPEDLWDIFRADGHKRIFAFRGYNENEAPESFLVALIGENYSPMTYGSDLTSIFLERAEEKVDWFEANQE